MSKIGKKPIIIPEDVSLEIKEGKIEVKGPNATLSVPLLENVEIKMEDSQISFITHDTLRQTKSNWGTLRSLVQNAIQGAKENFTKSLIIEGVGFRASMEGKDLLMNLGFSHPIKFETPEGINIEVEGNTLKITGADKALVGEVAANIRKFKKPEPYKGKGIRYNDEVVRRKAGKKAVSGK